jgi:hypothetical protein
MHSGAVSSCHEIPTSLPEYPYFWVFSFGFEADSGMPSPAGMATTLNYSSSSFSAKSSQAKLLRLRPSSGTRFRLTPSQLIVLGLDLPQMLVLHEYHGHLCHITEQYLNCQSASLAWRRSGNSNPLGSLKVSIDRTDDAILEVLFTMLGSVIDIAQTTGRRKSKDQPGVLCYNRRYCISI